MNIICLDTEHSNGVFHPWEDGFYLSCVSIISNTNKDTTIWFDHYEKEYDINGIEKIQKWINWSDLIVAHNAKHDINILRYFGIKLDETKLHCTMLSDYMLWGQDKQKRWNLNAICDRYELDNKDDKVKQYWDLGYDTYDIPAEILGPYCVKDCKLTYQIYNIQKDRVNNLDMKKIIDLQNEYTYCLSDMELNGFKFDTDRAEEFIEEFSEKREDVRKQLLKKTRLDNRVNFDSHQQLSAILYGGLLKLERKEWIIRECKTKPYSYYNEQKFTDEIQYKGIPFNPISPIGKDGYYKTDKKTIRQLGAPTKLQKEIKKLLIEYSEFSKVSETLKGKGKDKGLINKIQPDGLIHTKLNQAITATSRLSSSDPNAQNIPRDGTSPLKRCIVPKLDGILQDDLSQIEWRMAAFCSQDGMMIREINRGVDQHAKAVVDLMELPFKNKKDPESKRNRFYAKIFNFRMIFRGSAYGYYRDIDMPQFTLKKWERIVVNFWKKYRGLGLWHTKIITEVKKTGALKSQTGRWWQFHKTKSVRGSKIYSDRQIASWPVQGGAGGDILPLMAVIIRRGMRRMGMKSQMILTVHDSLVFDYVNEEKDKLIKLCYDVGNNLHNYIERYFGFKFNVKLECECESGPSYGELTYDKPV